MPTETGFFGQLRKGIVTYSEAHRFIVRHRLWGFLLVPGMIHIFLILVLIWLSLSFGEDLSERVTGLAGLNGESWYAKSLGFIIAIAARIFLLILYAFVYKYIVLIIMSPVLALLSEKTDEIITGKEYPFQFSQFLRDVIRSISITLRNMMIEIAFTLLVYVAAFIPFINLLGFGMMILVQSYFYGFSMIDYSSERRKMSVRESIRYVRDHKGIAIGNGLVFYLLFLVPVIGWMVAPSYAVVAATLATLEAKDRR